MKIKKEVGSAFNRMVFFLASITFLAFSGFFFYFQIFESWYEADEAFFLLGGALMNRGFQLYEEFVDNKPPPIFIIASIIDFLSLNFVGLKVLMLLVSTTVFLLFYKVLEGIKGAGIKNNELLISFLFSVFMISFPLFSFLSLRLEQLFIYSVVISLYLYFKKSNILASSFFIALTPFFKPTYIIFWLLFFYLDRKFIVPTVGFFILLGVVFLLLFGEEMVYSIIGLSLLKAKGFYEYVSPITFYTKNFNFLIYLLTLLITSYVLREEIKKSKILRFIFLFSLLYFVGLFLGLFSFGFYNQILSPLFFFFPFILFLSFIRFISNAHNFKKPSIKNALIVFVFIFLLINQALLLNFQLSYLEIKNARTTLCVGCLTKEDGEVLFSLKSSNKRVLLASRDPSLYYPYFIELIPPSIPASEVIERDGLFPCFTACPKILEGEYEYFVESIKRENFDDYETIVFDKNIESYICSGEKFYCFDKEEEKVIEEKLRNSGYSLFYSGDAILVYSKEGKS